MYGQVLGALEAQDAGARRAAVLAYVAARIVVGDAALEPFAARLSPMHAQLVQVRPLCCSDASLGVISGRMGACRAAAIVQTSAVCHAVLETCRGRPMLTCKPVQKHKRRICMLARAMCLSLLAAHRACAGSMMRWLL